MRFASLATRTRVCRASRDGRDNLKATRHELAEVGKGRRPSPSELPLRS